MKEKKGKIKTLISLSRRKCTFLCFLMLIYANTNDMQIFATKNTKICKPLQRKLRKLDENKSSIKRCVRSNENL